jgi:hypothetical protein
MMGICRGCESKDLCVCVYPHPEMNEAQSRDVGEITSIVFLPKSQSYPYREYGKISL